MRTTALALVAAVALSACPKPEGRGDAARVPDEPAVDAAVAPPPPLPERSTDPGLAVIDDYIAQSVAAKEIDRSRPGWKTRLHAPPKVRFTPGKVYVWHLVTNLGELQVQMLPEVAPQHVANFLYLTRLGFFDGLAFHRVVRGFMAQGGDPLGTGAGGPGYGIAPEVEPSVRHDRRGVVSTAHSQAPKSDGSQFFLMFEPWPGLDMQYAIFGRVFSGTATLDKIEALGRPPDYEAQYQKSPPLQPITIEKATVEVR